MKILEKIKEKYYIFLSILSTVALIITLGQKTSNIIGLFFFLGLGFFYYKAPKEWLKPDKGIKVIISLLFALFHVLGNYEVIQGSSESLSDTFLFLISLVVSVIGWGIVFYYLVSLIFAFSEETEIQLVVRKKQHNKVFIKVCVIFLVCWLPYFIIYFPGIMTPDTIIQFKQIQGQIPYNNHHPVVHTAFMHLTFLLGYEITNSVNIGIACCTFIQMIVMAVIYSSVFSILYAYGINKKLLLVFVGFFSIIPFNALYTVTLLKDTIFSGLVLLFSVLLWLIIQNNMNKSFAHFFWIGFILLGILMCLFRTNGFYAFIICIPFMCLNAKQHLKAVIISIFTILFCVVIIKGPVMNALNIQQPDSAENLSLPLQHIGRVLNDGREISEEEREKLNRFMDVDGISDHYIDYCSDTMKNYFREQGGNEYFREHKIDFFIIWAELGVKYPDEYIKAQIAETKGYWTTDVQVDVNPLGMFDSASQVGAYPTSPKWLTNATYYFVNLYRVIPILGVFWSIGFYFWVFLLALFLAIKHKRAILPFIPSLSVWATLIVATPVFAEFRYIYPMIISVPFLLLISWSSKDYINNTNP